MSLLQTFSNMKTKTKISLGMAVPLVFLVILGVIAYINVSSISYTSGWVNHTYKVLAKADAIIAAAVDMETGMRGYLLAGKEEFLDPYKSGQKAFYERVVDLQETVSDNPPQVARLKEVENTIREWQNNVTEMQIALRRDINKVKTMDHMADLIAEARGKQYFDKFREQIALFKQREQTLLTQRSETFNRNLASGNASQSVIADNLKWVNHTHKVLAEADSILAAAVDMETGMRGFLLAGKEEFLEPYNSGQSLLFARIAKMKKTVSDNPSQVKLLTKMNANMQEWQSKVTTSQIALRRDIAKVKTMDNVADLVSRALGKKYFDKFRGQIALFKKREQILLDQRNQRFNQNLNSGNASGAVIQDNLKWVNHTYKVLSKADNILASAVDMETGMRGYLLAGKEEFLDPYKNGSASLFSLLTEMKQTVSDNPAQVNLLGLIEKNMQGWKDNVTENMINLRRSVNKNKKMFHMADLIAEARGKQYFDKFRSLINAFKAEEAALIVTRQEANEATVNQTHTMIIGCVTISIILGGLIAFFIGGGIASPLNRMTNNMSRLADGDTSINIDGLKRQDEIGAMAQALEIFKQNRIEADKLEAQEKIRLEQDRQRDAEEKEKAQQELFERQEQEKREKKAAQELAEVVQACAGGDFSKRLNTADKDGIFLSLCEGVNEIGEIADGGLNEIQQVIGALSKGHLDIRIKGNYKGIFNNIKEAFNNTVETLTDIVTQIATTTDLVTDASGEISQGSVNLSERTDQQAASLEETAASMEELTSTVKENSNNADNANNLTTEANQKAIEGGDIVNNVVSAMHNIESSSSKISDIISVIDQISSQVNLLALNAAVEAARAGEAGRGFAVVAAEVRSLAVRSAEASADIRSLISSSASEVNNGTNLVNKASLQLQEIMESVAQVTTIVSDISQASREQSTSIGEINSAVAQMDSMTQKNAVLVEKNSTISNSMQKQAQDLKNMMAFFKLDSASSGSPKYDDLIRKAS